LTTISLLYAALYDAFRRMKGKDEEVIAEQTNLKYRIVQKNLPDSPRLELSLQSKNQEDYLYILHELKLIGARSKPLHHGVRRLRRCYRFFRNNLEDEKPMVVKGVLDKLNQALLVKIEVSNLSDAFVLFESLNDRGTPLSPVDLIKTKLISKFPLKHADAAFKKWRELIDNIPEENTQERFLRHFYHAFKHRKEIGLPRYPKATKSTVIDIYEKLIDKDPEYLSDELLASSSKYKSFLSPEEFYGDSLLRQRLADLRRIQGAPGYTLLLYLASRDAISEKSLGSVADILVRYFVRRHLMGFPETQKLDQIFIDLVEMLHSEYGKKLKTSIRTSEIVSFLEDPDRSAPLKEVHGRLLSSPVYDENPTLARFLLAEIENSQATKERKRDFWAQIDGRYVWTLEHIMPQADPLPSAWVKMVGSGNRQKAEEIHEKYVHVIGNLTLTAYNSNLSDKSFIDKRNKKDERGRPIGFKNGLSLNRSLAKLTQWTESEIRNRSKELADHAVDVLNLSDKKT